MKIKAIKTDRITANQFTLIEFLDKYVSELKEGSVVAITSKIVSLCEGRVAKKGSINKYDLAKEDADYYLPAPINSNQALGFFLTIKDGILIPVAGIDESNSDGDYVLWPLDSQKSANEAREFLVKKFKLNNVGVVITDSKTTPLRWGVTGVGMAVSGFLPLNDYRGKEDLFGRKLEVSQVSAIDALAGMAVFAMGEGSEACPLVVMNDFTAEQVQFTGREDGRNEYTVVPLGSVVKTGKFSA